MKFVQPSPYSDPAAAARKIMEIANSLEPYMDGRLLTEKLNAAMLYEHKALPAQYGAGIQYCVDNGWLTQHMSGFWFYFTQRGKDLFA